MLYWLQGSTGTSKQVYFVGKIRPLYFKFSAELNELTLAPRNNWRCLKTFYDLLALEKRVPYKVRGLRVNKVIMTKFWKLARTVNVMVLRRFKKPISYFQIAISRFFSLFFFLFLLCSLFSFGVLDSLCKKNIVWVKSKFLVKTRQRPLRF